jgi:hypothetical protein
MKGITAITVAAVLMTGCVTRVVEVDEGQSPEAQVTQTTAPPATTPRVTAPRVTTPPATTPRETISSRRAEYSDDLDYISGFCYTDCTRDMPATWERFLELATPEGLALAVGIMADRSFSEIDSICDEFWQRTDISVINEAANDFGVFDTDAMMATLYYVCDS